MEWREDQNQSGCGSKWKRGVAVESYKCDKSVYGS